MNDVNANRKDSCKSDRMPSLSHQPMPPATRRHWLYLGPAMVLPFAGALVYFVVLDGSRLAGVVYGGIKLFTLVFPLLVVARTGWPDRDLGGRARHGRSLPLGLASGLGIAAVIVTAFVWTPAGELVRAHADRIQAKVEGLGVAGWYPAFAVLMTLLHSLLEEYYWRWFVYGRLRLVAAPVVAHLLAGLAFALHHYVILQAYVGFVPMLVFGTFVGVGGVIWSYQYNRYGSLLGAWLSHALVDAALFAIGYHILN